MLFNRLLTADWLLEIKIERGGWRNKQIEEWNENTWNWNRFLCFSDDKWERKTLRQQRAGEGERLHFFVCVAECGWSRAFNEESKKERQEKQRKEEWNKALAANSRCYLQAFSRNLHVPRCAPLPSHPFVKDVHLNIRGALEKKSTLQGGTSLESADTFCSSLFRRSLMEFSSGAQAGKQQQPHAPQLHPFDCALLHVHVYGLQCTNQTSAARQLISIRLPVHLSASVCVGLSLSQRKWESGPVARG